MTAEVFPEAGLFQRGAAAFAASIPEHPADDGFFGPGTGSFLTTAHAHFRSPNERRSE